MIQYKIFWAGPAEGQFNDLLARAIAAGKEEAFRKKFSEMGRDISDPSKALQVGRALRQTVKPGGFERCWQNDFLYVIYYIFPDEECGWITHIDFNPPSWA